MKDIINKLKKEIDIDKHDILIKKIMKNNKGDLEVKLEEKTMGGIENFKKCIHHTIGDNIIIERHTPKKFIKILNLDDFTFEMEVKEAIINSGLFNKIDIDRLKIKVIKTKYSNNIAFIEGEVTIINKLIEMKKLKIGWLICNILEEIKIIRCYNCNKYGHIAKKCSVEKKQIHYCFKCGDQDHIIEQCKNNQKCLVCNSNNHRTDSFKCPLYKLEIEKIQNKLNKLNHNRNGTNLTSKLSDR